MIRSKILPTIVLRERVCVSGRWPLIAGDVDSRLFSWNAKQIWRVGHGHFRHLHQGTLIHGEVSLYGWSPVCFVCIQLICLCWMNNSFTCFVKSKPVKQKVSCTVILPLWWEFSAFTFYYLWKQCNSALIHIGRQQNHQNTWGLPIVHSIYDLNFLGKSSNCTPLSSCPN